MSKSVRPMVFRTLDGEPVVPSWLRRNSQRVLPAPFTPQNDVEPYHPPHPDEGEPEPFPSRGGMPPQPQQYVPQPQHLSQPQYSAQPQQGAQPQPGAPPQRPPMPAAQGAGGQFAPQPPPNYGATPPSMPPPGPNAPRRSSLPPRFSAPPPQVVISRPPPRTESLPPAPAAPTPAEVEQFAMAALELGSLRARILMQAEAQVLELAVAVAEAIIEREVELDPSIHETLARAAVGVLGDTSSAKLRVSRAAHKAITDLHGGPAVDVEGVRVELVIDNSLDGLSVIAESGASRVDGRVSERLAAVLRAVEAEHRRRDAGEEE